MSAAPGRPPRLWRALIRAAADAGTREFLVGDLDEEFAAFERRRDARRWYRSQAVRSALLALRLRRAKRRAPSTGDPGDAIMRRRITDLRYALRGIRRNPAFAGLVVATLGIASGAAIAIFTVADEVLFEPLGFPDPDALVVLWESNQERDWTRVDGAPANILDWRERVGTLEDIAFFSEYLSSATIEVGDAAEYVQTGMVSGNFFELLGRPPTLGRAFRWEETWADSEPAILLSDATWRGLFQADPEVVGRTIHLDRTAYTVIGVMPDDFESPSDADAWVTPRWTAELRGSVWFRQAHVVRPLARLAPGASIEQARAELASVAVQLQSEHPELNAHMEAGLGPLDAYLVRDERTPLVLLLGAVGLLLLIGIANVANLTLVRALGRHQEVAVRTSLGASRGSVVAQLLTESVLLGAAGVAVGLALAWGTLSLLRSTPLEGLPPLALDIDVRLLVFVIAITALSALLAGVAPALRGSRIDLRGVLADAGRGGMTGRTSLAWSNVIVTGQIALAVLLATAAGLTFRSLEGLSDVEDGVDGRNVLTFEIAPPSGEYDDRARARLAIDLATRLEIVPGIAEVGVSRALPLTGWGWTSDFTIEGWASDEYGINVRHREVLPGYFRALGIPVIEGRLFDAAVTPDRPLPVVVNRTFAETYFPEGTPVGRRIAFDRSPTEDSYWYEIAAVVGDERMSFKDEPAPEIIAHLFGDVPSVLRWVVKGTDDPASLMPQIRAALADLDAGIPIRNIRTMDEIRRGGLSRERFVFVVFGALALCALLLSCVGVYGVSAQAARYRIREVGIRQALGATRSRILGEFLGAGMRWVALGLAIGLGGALLAGRVMESLLWGVRPSDPATLFGVLAILAGAGVLASYLPAWRASRQDPAAVLREG